jgi:uncharacterized membrane protein
MQYTVNFVVLFKLTFYPFEAHVVGDVMTTLLEYNTVYFITFLLNERFSELIAVSQAST